MEYFFVANFFVENFFVEYIFLRHDSSFLRAIFCPNCFDCLIHTRKGLMAQIHEWEMVQGLSAELPTEHHIFEILSMMLPLL